MAAGVAVNSTASERSLSGPTDRDAATGAVRVKDGTPAVKVIVPENPRLATEPISSPILPRVPVTPTLPLKDRPAGSSPCGSVRSTSVAPEATDSSARGPPARLGNAVPNAQPP